MALLQDLLYSCSSNRIHVWKGCEDFSMVNELDTHYGSLYSLTTTKKYIITGANWLLLFVVVLWMAG